MSAHAVFCLLTLMLLAGLVFGLGVVLSAIHGPAKPGAAGSGATRGDGAQALCTHASAAFDPRLDVQAMSRLLRSEDAWILYGPDEFGEFQLRFGSAVNVADGIRSLGARAEVKSIKAHSKCE